MINEYESRLVDDIRQFLVKLAPPSNPYLHNDLHLRPQSEEVWKFELTSLSRFKKTFQDQHNAVLCPITNQGPSFSP